MTFMKRMGERQPALRQYADNRGWIFMLMVTTLIAGVFVPTIVIQVKRGVDFLGAEFEDFGIVQGAFPLDITPTTATFNSEAIFVYILVVMIAVFAFCLIFIPNQIRGGFLYYSPPFWPALTFFTLTLAFIFIACLYVTYSLLLPQWACFFGVLATLFAMITVGAAFNGLEAHGQELVDDNFRSLVVSFIIVVQNGLAFISTWALALTVYIFGQVLVYEIGTVSVIDAGSTVLAILGFILFFYFFLQIVVYRKKLRWAVSPYLAYIWFHSGILVANWDTDSRNAILCLVLVLTAVVLLKFVLIMGSFREYKEQVFKNLKPNSDAIPPSYDESTSSGDVEKAELKNEDDHIESPEVVVENEGNEVKEVVGGDEGEGQG